MFEATNELGVHFVMGDGVRQCCYSIISTCSPEASTLGLTASKGRMELNSELYTAYQQYSSAFATIYSKMFFFRVFLLKERKTSKNC